MAILIAILLPVWFVANHQMVILYAQMDEHSDGEELYGIRVRILKKEIKNEKLRYTVKVTDEPDQKEDAGSSREHMIGRRGIVTSESTDLPVGGEAVIDIKLKELLPAQNEGGFDAKRYYACQGITFYGGITAYHGIKRGFPLQELLWDIREETAAFYERELPGEESGLMSAMALGDKGSLDSDVKELFSEAGIAHLLAVSGLHISIVGMGLYRLLRSQKLSYLAAGLISIFVVGCYGMMTGLSVSTLRAVIMFCVMIGGECLGEAYDVGSAAALAAIIILCGSPVAIFDVGFLFSFAAVFGIVYVAAPLQKVYEKRRRNRFMDMAAPPQLSTVERFVSALIFGAGLQLATLPVIAISYHRISPYVILLNILLLPFMGLLIGWGLFAGLLHLGGFLLLPCHCILYIYEMVSDLMLRMPGAVITVGQPKVWQVVLYFLLMAAGLLSAKRQKKILIPAAVFSLAFFVLTFTHPTGTEIDMLSVGQGDGLCICTREGQVFMVDGGSSSESELSKYTLLPYFRYRGIDRINYWFVTHLDEDHYSGLFELLSDGYRVEHVVLAKALEKNEAFYELLKLCEENGTEVVYMERDDVCGTDSLRFTCLFPDYPSGFSGTNENSLCLLLSYGDFDMLLTGDMGEEQELAVLDCGVMPDIEVLKSAHHGSKNSNCEKWLDAVDPKLAIISAGKNNRYHHPSAETLERFRERQIPSLCTIDSGEIRIYPDTDGRFAVEGMLDIN